MLRSNPTFRTFNLDDLNNPEVIELLEYHGYGEVDNLVCYAILEVSRIAGVPISYLWLPMIDNSTTVLFKLGSSTYLASFESREYAKDIVESKRSTLSKIDYFIATGFYIQI